MIRRRRSASIGAVLALALAVVVGPGPARGQGHEISIVDFAYEPAAISVMTGEPITWTNTGAATHTVTSVAGSELDSGDVGPTEGYGHVFETPGVYAYHCTIHPDRMNGTITVTAAAATPVPSGPREPTPPAGTLPPDFSPNPSVGPAATPTPTPAPSGTPAPAATAAPGSATGGQSGLPLVLLLVVLGLAGLALALWLRSHRTA